MHPELAKHDYKGVNKTITHWVQEIQLAQAIIQ